MSSERYMPVETLLLEYGPTDVLLVKETTECSKVANDLYIVNDEVFLKPWATLSKGHLFHV